MTREEKIAAALANHEHAVERAGRALKAALEKIDASETYNAIAESNKLRRAMALLMRRDGLTYREIGEVHAVSATAARVQVFQAERDLRQRMGIEVTDAADIQLSTDS